MEKEKQIDEIAKLICTYPQCVNYNKIGGCKIAECQTVDIAENLYNAGYRKEIQGEWVKPQFLSRTGFFTIREFTCNQCNKFFEVREGNEFMNYCPNCGAKMKGAE